MQDVWRWGRNDQGMGEESFQTAILQNGIWGIPHSVQWSWLSPSYYCQQEKQERRKTDLTMWVQAGEWYERPMQKSSHHVRQKWAMVDFQLQKLLETRRLQTVINVHSEWAKKQWGSLVVKGILRTTQNNIHQEGAVCLVLPKGRRMAWETSPDSLLT